MSLINYESCDGTCNGKCDEGATQEVPGLGMMPGAGGSTPPPGKDPKNPFNLSPERRAAMKKDKKEAKKFKKKYDTRYRVAFAIVIVASVVASVGAEIAYTGCGLTLFGMLTLIGSRIAMTGAEHVRNMIAQYIVRTEMTLGGTEVLNPKDMVDVNTSQAKPVAPQMGQYL